LLWRAGIAGDLLMQVADILTIIIFYLLLRPISRSLALMSTAFNLIQTAVLALNKLALLTRRWRSWATPARQAASRRSSSNNCRIWPTSCTAMDSASD